MIKIGNCGWSYLNAQDFFGTGWKERFRTKLQAYVSLFDTVEINSTFYRLPKTETAKKWREEADEINPDFEFTVKVSQIITHFDRFSSEKSLFAFKQIEKTAEALRAKVLLFQSPASFKPSEKNIEKVKRFFENIERRFLFAWEVRWERDWNKETVSSLFSELKITHCVDPLRQECFHSEKMVYYRLHGFGKPSMYNYSFSEQEIQNIKEKIVSQNKPVYVFFNNADCYKNALELRKITETNIETVNLRQ